MKDRKDWLADLVEEVFLPADLRCIIKVHFTASLCFTSDFLLCIFINRHHLRRRRSSLLAIISSAFSPPQPPTTISNISHRQDNFAKSPRDKSSSNIKVSYYDKLLDACEHVAVKRGRAPLIREVFSHWSTLVCGSVLMLLRLEVLWSCSSLMAGAQRRRRWGLRAKFWQAAIEKADIPILEETKERAMRRIADFATLRKAPLVSKRASIRSICYLNICDKILWVEKKREEEKFGRGRAGSQQKIANLPGPSDSKMRIVHL